MKVLIVCHDHPYVTDGGTEHVAHDLCRVLSAQPGVSATFLGVSTSLSHPHIPSGSLHRMGRDYLLQTGRYDMFAMRRLDGIDWVHSIERLLDQTNPDVVHLHGLDRIGAEIVVLLRRLRPGLKLVLTLHDFQLICPNRGLMIRHDGGLCAQSEPVACRRCLPNIEAGSHALRRARLTAILSEVDAFVAPSRDLRDRFVEWGLPADRIAVIPNAVEESVPLNSAKRPRPDRFAYFGNLAEHKGVNVLLKAACNLARREAELRVTLYGRFNHPSEEQQSTFDAAIAAAAPVAQFVGPYDRSEIHSLMAQTDWVVLPSLWYENAPLVVLEARRAGRPVICTALGGMAELVRDGIDGVYVPRGDPAALAETMEAAAGDTALWKRLSDNVQPPPDITDAARQHLDLYLYQPERMSA